VVYVLGVEPHESGRLHAHALLRFPECFGDVLLLDGWKLWFEWHGLARLERPQCQAAVTEYTCKYVTKPGADLVLSESFQAAAMADPARVA
jgi:hypothetical protein